MASEEENSRAVKLEWNGRLVPIMGIVMTIMLAFGSAWVAAKVTIARSVTRVDRNQSDIKDLNRELEDVQDSIIRMDKSITRELQNLRLLIERQRLENGPKKPN